jgi:hypothetical protein
MANLLQSDGWEQFQQALGRRTWRVNDLLAIEVSLKFGLTYLSSPRGLVPLSSTTQEQVDDSWSRIVRESRVVFWRAAVSSDSPMSMSIGNMRDAEVVVPRLLRRQMEPIATWRVRVDVGDDELLSAMHQKHRYNIRLAERRGIAVLPSTSGIDVFWSLLQETAMRQNIQTHPRSYYETMMQSLPGVHVVIAERASVPCAAALIVHHANTATYLHGGSSYKQRKHMAPHLLHVAAMRAARDAGMTWYDFGGVSTTDAHAWSGLTRFKRGFGGEIVYHAPTKDLLLRRGWYSVLSAVAQLRTK